MTRRIVAVLQAVRRLSSEHNRTVKDLGLAAALAALKAADAARQEFPAGSHARTLFENDVALLQRNVRTLAALRSPNEEVDALAAATAASFVRRTELARRTIRLTERIARRDIGRLGRGKAGEPEQPR